MPTESGKPLIVISYAHADEPEKPAADEVKWLSFVTGYLRPAIKQGAVNLWIDRVMPGGADWEREIEQKLRACEIFILLVSRHSLSSDYVVDKEIAIIRERQAKGEDVRFYPLVLTPTPKIALDRVRDKNLRPRDGKPFSESPLNERYRHMSEAADEIAAIAQEIVARNDAASSRPARTVDRQVVLAPTRARPLLRLSAGDAGPFFATKGKMNSTERTYYLKVENIDNEKHVTEIKLSILSIEPQEDYIGPWEIESGFTLAAGDHKFVPLVQYGEGNSDGYSSSAYSRSDSFFVVLTKGGIGKQPTGPKAVPQTILVRATGIGTAPCDYACRVWVQNPDGRLRISASDETTAPPTVASSPINEAYMNKIAVNTVEINVGRGAPYESIEPAGVNKRQFVRVCLQNKSLIEVANCKLDIVGLDPPNEKTSECNLKSDITIGPNSERFVDVAYYDIGSSQALAGRHIGLAVPQVGGFFAEAYSFARLPLTAHSFNLRLSRFSEVYDEISCRLFIDNQGLLKLESSLDSGRDELEIKDRASLEAWLKGQSAEVAVAIAMRAALRVAPLAAEARERLGATRNSVLSNLTSAVFRASAVARVSAKYPARSKEFRAAGNAAADAAGSFATTDAAALAVDASAVAVDAAFALDADSARFAAARASAVAADAADATAIWESIGPDASAVQEIGAIGLADLPLWPKRSLAWAGAEWIGLKTALPRGENWEVWVNWYEDRLRGGSRGEAYETVFARVPQEEWDKGAAAANAWIKAHLPKPSESAKAAEVPEPVASVESPWTYSWTAKATITIAAGSESFPFYPFFNSEQEHRQTMEVCRVGAEKLLKKLQNRRYDNVRPEYRERLEAYLQNLPRTTASGNILLAYDEILNLRSDFAADVKTLPTPFATDLSRVIENQFALNTFYDIVARHNEAIASATRSAPYPSEALGPLNEFISANTPRVFEPNVSEAQRRLERAGPRDNQPTPAASTPEGDSWVVQPPPLPPATPDATRAHQRQTAANYNALWEIFVKAPTAVEGWWHLAQELGNLVKPFLDYLRG